MVGQTTQPVRSSLLDRIRGEFIEMPGLSLTPVQARRLWGLELPDCEELLDALVERHFLIRGHDGAYRRANLVESVRAAAHSSRQVRR